MFDIVEIDEEERFGDSLITVWVWVLFVFFFLFTLVGVPFP